MFSICKLIWAVKLDKGCYPLLLIFGLLLGICFGGVAVDIFNPGKGTESLINFFSGFLFGQFVSVTFVKAISM